MSLLQSIKRDQLQARKDKKMLHTKLLTTLLSESARPGLDDGKRESTDDEVMQVVKKFIKNIRETLSHRSNDDLIVELTILEQYLPSQLTEAQIIEALKGHVDEHPTMGSMMSYLKCNYAGQYDGQMASTVIKGLL